MNIVIIVNIIISLGILLGGYCMKKYFNSHSDYSIGFRTKRAKSSKEAWGFANQKCGLLWIAIGVIYFILTVAMIFIVQNERFETIAQLFVLILQIASAIVSCVVVENRLKNKYGE